MASSPGRSDSGLCWLTCARRCARRLAACSRVARAASRRSRPTAGRPPRPDRPSARPRSGTASTDAPCRVADRGSGPRARRVVGMTVALPRRRRRASPRGRETVDAGRSAPRVTRRAGRPAARGSAPAPRARASRTAALHLDAPARAPASRGVCVGDAGCDASPSVATTTVTDAPRACAVGDQPAGAERLVVGVRGEHQQRDRPRPGRPARRVGAAVRRARRRRRAGVVVAERGHRPRQPIARARRGRARRGAGARRARGRRPARRASASKRERRRARARDRPGAGPARPRRATTDRARSASSSGSSTRVRRSPLAASRSAQPRRVQRDVDRADVQRGQLAGSLRRRANDGVGQAGRAAVPARGDADAAPGEAVTAQVPAGRADGCGRRASKSIGTLTTVRSPRATQPLRRACTCTCGWCRSTWNSCRSSPTWAVTSAQSTSAPSEHHGFVPVRRDATVGHASAASSRLPGASAANTPQVLPGRGRPHRPRRGSRARRCAPRARAPPSG